MHRVLSKFIVHEHARVTGTTIIRIAYGHAGTCYLSIFLRIIDSVFSLEIFEVSGQNSAAAEMSNRKNGSRITPSVDSNVKLQYAAR
jgi:hypothetical protein